MRRITLAFAAALVLSFAAMPASACPGVCMYDGEKYSSGAKVGKRVCWCPTENHCRWTDE